MNASIATLASNTARSIVQHALQAGMETMLESLLVPCVRSLYFSIISSVPCNSTNVDFGVDRF